MCRNQSFKFAVQFSIQSDLSSFPKTYVVQRSFGGHGHNSTMAEIKQEYLKTTMFVGYTQQGCKIICAQVVRDEKVRCYERGELQTTQKLVQEWRVMRQVRITIPSLRM